jgi:hypothetical protein
VRRGHRRRIYVPITGLYHWTLLRRGLRAEVPSIILCVKKWNLPGPQRRGSPHSGEGKNGRFHLIKTERRGYEKIPLVGFQDMHKTDYHWTFLRRGLRAPSPSIILCVKKGTSFVPQRRGYSHSGEGKNGLVRHFTVERRGYEKIPVVEFKDGYKTDLQNSFRVNRIILRGVLTLVTQILSRIW